MVSLLVAGVAWAYMPICQIQGHVSVKGDVTIAAYGINQGREVLATRTAPDKEGNYKLYFGGTDRNGFSKLFVRLQDKTGKTLKEVEVPPREPGKECRNTVDF